MRIVIAEHAAKQIKKLDQPLKERLKKAIVHISENPSIGKFLEKAVKDHRS